VIDELGKSRRPRSLAAAVERFPQPIAGSVGALGLAARHDIGR
jgi:hypothetical protein